MAIGCRSNDDPPPLGAGIDGVILGADQSQEFGQGGRGFRPTELDVRRAETALPAFLAAPADAETKKKRPYEEDQRKKILAKLSTYKRQWAGIDRGKTHVLYMNFLCHYHDDSWRKGAVTVSDGGDCYFHVEYDLGTGQFASLRVNGEA